MLTTLLGVTEVMLPALVKNPGVTYQSVTEWAEMCLIMETNAAKDPGHSHHHPHRPTKYLCLLRLSQWLCLVEHAILCWNFSQWNILEKQLASLQCRCETHLVLELSQLRCESCCFPQIRH